LVDHWQQLISEHASLEGKALLLPVRINLAKEDLNNLTEQQSWFTLLGFELVIEKQFVMVKKLPCSLYLLDVNQALEFLLQACKNQFENLESWLKWQRSHVPERYFTSNAFAAELLQMKNNPQTIQRLRSKAVKIDLHHYLTQLD
jgi:DNA mismatch repair protein MutL